MLFAEMKIFKSSNGGQSRYFFRAVWLLVVGVLGCHPARQLLTRSAAQSVLIVSDVNGNYVGERLQE
jgi:hypothetical protein